MKNADFGIAGKEVISHNGNEIAIALTEAPSLL
jgi:hypothetical protein